MAKSLPNPEYVAGIFDTISEIRAQHRTPNKKSKDNRRKYEEWSWCVRIYGRPSLVARLQNYFGGVVDENPRSFGTFRLEIKSREAAKFLEWVLPHLLDKKDAAHLALEFQKSFNDKFGVNGVPQDIRNYRTMTVAKINDMSTRTS